MTRLTEAFDRARGSSGAPEQPPAAPVPGADEIAAVPGTWRFDGDEMPTATSAADEDENEVPITREDLEQVDYPFAKTPTIAGRLVVGATPNHTLVEQFRHLAASLHHAQLKTGT